MSHSIEKTGSTQTTPQSGQPSTPGEVAQGAGERFSLAMQPGTKKNGQPTDEADHFETGTDTPEATGALMGMDGQPIRMPENVISAPSAGISGIHSPGEAAEAPESPLMANPFALGLGGKQSISSNSRQPSDTRSSQPSDTPQLHGLTAQTQTAETAFSAKTSEPTDAEGAKTPGDNILAALQATSGTTTFAGAETTVRTNTLASPAPTPSTAPTALVDRILTSVPSANGPAEIRIALKDSVLPDTEIRIQRTGEQLAVLFVTGNDAAEKTLSTQLRDLQVTLTQRFSGEVRIGLERPDMDGNAQGDGRSRQQRNLFEELAEESRKKTL